jgi:peroxiredoxin
MRLEGKTLDGKALNLADYRGKVVLVDFWATWCHYCTEEIPNIKQNYTNYHDKGFEVLGISVDTCPREMVVEFVKKEEVPWAICRDVDSPTKVSDYYGIHGYPTMILVGRDGKVISLNARGSGLGPLVEKALAAAAGEIADKSSGGKPSAGDEAGLKKDKGKPKADDAAAAKKNADEPPKTAGAVSRTWTDDSGTFKAKFRGLINKNVKLEREDGRVVTVPLEKLSDEDRAFIKKRKSGATP